MKHKSQGETEMTEQVKSQFAQPGSGQVWSTFWNGKTYGNGNQYITCRVGNSEVRVTVNNGAIESVSGARSLDFGKEAAKSVGLL